jgi:hypothetical protein
MKLLIYKPTVNRGTLKKQSFQGRRGDSEHKFRQPPRNGGFAAHGAPASLPVRHTGINEYHPHACVFAAALISMRACGPLFTAHLSPHGSPLCPAPTLVAAAAQSKMANFRNLKTSRAATADDLARRRAHLQVSLAPRKKQSAGGLDETLATTGRRPPRKS